MASEKVLETKRSLAINQKTNTKTKDLLDPVNPAT